MGRRRQPFRHLATVALADITAAEARTQAVAPETVQRLTSSLRRQGQREPVLVAGAAAGRADAPPYRLVVGVARLLAARELGWEHLQAVVLDASFAAELAAIDALEAGQADPWQLSEALARLRARCGWTQTQLGAAIGRTRDFVAGLLAIQGIAPEVRDYLARNTAGRPLTARHLRYIGRASRGRQFQVAREIVEQGLSTKVLEERFRRGAAGRQYIKVRALPQPGRSRAPQTTTEWRRYYRKLTTDLRRVEEQESHELRRTAHVVEQARQRERIIRQEARAKRKALARELRRATRQLARRGAL